jgi:hypothetical protein
MTDQEHADQINEACMALARVINRAVDDGLSVTVVEIPVEKFGKPPGARLYSATVKRVTVISGVEPKGDA